MTGSEQWARLCGGAGRPNDSTSVRGPNVADSRRSPEEEGRFELWQGHPPT